MHRLKLLAIVSNCGSSKKLIFLFFYYFTFFTFACTFYIKYDSKRFSCYIITMADWFVASDVVMPETEQSANCSSSSDKKTHWSLALSEYCT